MLNFLLLSFLVLAVSFFYYLNKRTFSYWKERNVPYIKTKLWHGNTRRLGKKFHTFEFVSKVYNELKDKGPIGGVFISFLPTAITTDLDLVKSVLVKDFKFFQNRGIYYNPKDDPISAHISNIENEQWKSIRSKLTPTFTSGKLRTMFDTINEISDKFITTIQNDSSDSIEIKQILARFTCDVIGEVAFGIKCNSLNDKKSKFFEMAVKSMDSFDFVQRLVLMGYKNVARFLRMKLTPDDVSKFYIDVVNSIIDYRNHNKDNNPEDLMNNLISMMKSGTITMDQVAANSFFYFIAGYETTSTALTFCIYELSQNRELQQQARNEVEKILEKYQGKMTYEAINEMNLIEKITKETLRKWPPSATVQRETTSDYKLPNSMIVLEKGTAILIPVYAIHHNPEIYPDPDKFDPSRFDSEEIEKRHPFSFLPFGDGPRTCPGIKLSFLEIKLCIAKLLTNYQFYLDYEKTEFPLKISPSNFMMTPAKGVFVKFEKIH